MKVTWGFFSLFCILETILWLRKSKTQLMSFQNATEPGGPGLGSSELQFGFLTVSLRVGSNQSSKNCCMCPAFHWHRWFQTDNCILVKEDLESQVWRGGTTASFRAALHVAFSVFATMVSCHSVDQDNHVWRTRSSGTNQSKTAVRRSI